MLLQQLVASHQSLESMHKIHKTAVAHIKIRWVSSLQPKLNIDSVGVNINQNPKFTDSLEVLKWVFPIMINKANSCSIDCGNPKAETTHSHGSSYLFYVLANWWLVRMIPFVCLHTTLRTPYWRLALGWTFLLSFFFFYHKFSNKSPPCKIVTFSYGHTHTHTYAYRHFLSLNFLKIMFSYKSHLTNSYKIDTL